MTAALAGIAIVSLAAHGLLASEDAAPRASGSDAPVLLAMVLDTSGSLHSAALARRQFFAEQVTGGLPAGSEVAVFAFDDQPRLVLERSSDRAAVAEAAGALGTAGRFTALYDALFDASRYLAEQAAARRAILLVTDGLDENSALTLEDGVDETRDLGIPVFAIGIGRVQSQVLRRIAKLTGGEYFAAESEGAEIARRIADVAPAAAPALQPAAAPAAAASETAAAGAPAPQAGVVAPAPVEGSPWLPLGLGLVVLAVALGAWAVWRSRPESAVATHRSAEIDPDEGGATMVTRARAIGEPGNTMVLTLKPLLHAIRGPDKGRLFEVSLDSAISIGRAEGNDVVLSDVAVSTEHCRIRPVKADRRAGSGGTFEVIDLKSTNGTWVNERRIGRHVLSPGDVVKVGETQLQLRMDHMRGA